VQENRGDRFADAAEVEPQAVDGGMEGASARRGEEQGAWLFVFRRGKPPSEFVGDIVFGTDDDSVLIRFAVNEKGRRLDLRKCVFEDVRELFSQEENGVVDGGIALLSLTQLLAVI